MTDKPSVVVPMSRYSKTSWSKQDYAIFWHKQKWFMLLLFMIIFIGFGYYSFTRPKIYRTSTLFTWDRIESLIDQNEIPLSQTRPSVDLFSGLIDEQAQNGIVANISNYVDSVGHSYDNALLKQEVKAVEVFPAKSSHAIGLLARSQDPLIAYKIVHETLKILQSKTDQIRNQEINKVLTFLEEKAKHTEKKLANTQQELIKLERSLPLRTKAIKLKGQNGQKKWYEILSKVRLEKELAAANVNSIKQQIKKLNNKAQPLNFETSNHFITIRQRLDSLIKERNHLVHRSDSDELAKLDQQIERLKNELIEKTIASGTFHQNDRVSASPSVFSNLQARLFEQELNLYLLKNKEGIYEKMVDQYQHQSTMYPEQTQEYERLLQTKEVFQATYAATLEKMEQLQFLLDTNPEKLRILKTAPVPSTPLTQYPMRMSAIGFYLGLLVALAAGLIRHNALKRLYNDNDVEQKTGQSLVGVIPRLDHSEENLKLVEDAFRGLCMRILFNPYHQPVRSLLFTSALPAEGKTFCAVNFAINCSELGKRILLIDTNLNAPRLGTLFNHRQGPGLCDWVMQKCSLSHIIQHDKCSIIQAGHLVENTTSILSHQRLKQLIKWGEEQYDLVILDASHILIPTSESILLAQLVSHSMMVVKRGKTDLTTIQSALEDLKRASAKILGIILNDVQGQNHYYKYVKPTRENGFASQSRSHSARFTR
jgi:capsular exopolysaccharide synthesis family protein